MVCCGDVADKNGQILIPDNTPIEEKHLRLLKAWGITELNIINNSEPETVQTDTPSTGAENTELLQRFILNKPHLPAVIEMKRILLSGASVVSDV